MPEDKPVAPQQAARPDVPRLTGLKKRQQIELAGKAMFLWVAVAAVALSFCIAGGQYLLSKWDYNNKIIGAKYTAAQTLSANLTNASQLKGAVDSLVANQDLASVKTKPSDPNTKSVLDALPTSLDPSALATSLQQAIFNRSGVTLESIAVPPEVAAVADAASVQQAVPQEVRFSAVVSGSFTKVKNLMNDLQNTIRPMKISSVTMTGNDSNLRVALDIVTYYQPAKSVTVQKVTVK